MSLEEMVEQAQGGNRAALESVVERIQGKIYGLAIRMLWHPEDARDATQEILIRIITHLGDFQRQSAFTTWAYRVAANHLSTMRKGRLEQQGYTFARFADELDENLSDAPVETGSNADHELLLAEIRIGCTLGMLLCLDRPHRLAYILGEIFELEGVEAAQVLGIAAPAFRKRLSRARLAIIAFMKTKCGLVNPGNRCRCHRRAAAAINSRRVDRQRLLFASSVEEAARFPEVLAAVRNLENEQRAVAIYRSHPEFSVADGFASWMRGLIGQTITC
jgi:RNA polymerase sigma factor (sigma-70 family)